MPTKSNKNTRSVTQDSAKKLEKSSAAPSPAARPISRLKREPTVFMVNKHGAVHEMPRALALERARQIGWRKATDAEVAELSARGGFQSFDDTVAARWQPEAIEEPEV